MPVEFKSVSELAAAFGTIPAELGAELRPALREAANLIADQAKANAAYSTRIPAAIYVHTRMSSAGGAVVGIDATKAPEARVLELGNAGSRDATKFAHPVFGGSAWVTQPTQPFLFPAVTAKKAEAVGLIEAAVRSATNLRGITHG